MSTANVMYIAPSSSVQVDWTAAAEKVGREYHSTALEYCQLTGKVNVHLWLSFIANCLRIHAGSAANTGFSRKRKR
jgi:hypothetical protein